MTWLAAGFAPRSSSNLTFLELSKFFGSLMIAMDFRKTLAKYFLDFIKYELSKFIMATNQSRSFDCLYLLRSCLINFPRLLQRIWKVCRIDYSKYCLILICLGKKLCLYLVNYLNSLNRSLSCYLSGNCSCYVIYL
jgi:hypothetical protein